MSPTKSKEAVPAGTGQASSKSTDTRVSLNSDAVKNSLIYPPTIPGVKDKQLIEVVKSAGFNRFNKSLMSECRRPDRYGICLHPAAVEAIYAAYPESRPDAPEAPRKRKRDGHRFTRRAGCRLSEEVLTTIYAYMEVEGKYKYISELVHGLLMDWLKERVKESAQCKTANMK